MQALNFERDTFAGTTTQVGLIADRLHSRGVRTVDKTTISGDYSIDERPVVEGAFEPTWRHVLHSQPYNRKFGREMTRKDHNRSHAPFKVFVRRLDGVGSR